MERFPYIGMRQEQAELMERVRSAETGHGGVVIVNGEAGAGKTSLVRQVLSRTSTSSVTAYCLGGDENPPFGPWLDMIRRLHQDKGWDRDTLPAPFGSSPSQWSAHEVAGMIAHWLGHRGQPLAVHIEDVHAADTASLDILRHLVTQLRDWPVLVIGTYRTDELTRRHPLWHLLPEMVRYGAVRIRMRRLTREEVAELLDKTVKEGWAQVRREPAAGARGTWADAAAASGASLAEIADRVYARTSGLALFVRELTEPFLRTGRVPMPDDPLPETLQQAIDSRLQRLPAGALEVLETAALLGEWFSYADLAEVVAPMSEEDLSDALDAAVALHVIHPEGTQGNEMVFVHALYREFLLQHLRGARRRRCHARIAEVLAGRGDVDLDTIAHHLSQAGDPRAAAYFCAAGDRARVLGPWPRRGPAICARWNGCRRDTRIGLRSSSNWREVCRWSPRNRWPRSARRRSRPHRPQGGRPSPCGRGTCGRPRTSGSTIPASCRKPWT
ncbi:ATP-binding protein [Alicyclobacillus macrosporangiidus]|uniref:ATP-binding protein n=1 Tax=Alicyclobacillus macrosporangiidus TaxID=392015 RepID=UPI0005514EC0|nr:AAA family ATPase [Alicyclobacillus macrosporangiidus]